MSKTLIEQIDTEMEADPEFLDWYNKTYPDLIGFYLPDVVQTMKRLMYTAWDAGFDNGYDFARDIADALKGIDFRADSIKMETQ